MRHRIKEVRKEKGLTQAQLAERLGVTPQGVSSIENSESVTLNTLKKVADALGCANYIELLLPRHSEGKFTLYIDEHGTVVLKEIEDSNELEEQEAIDEAYINKLAVPALKLNNTGRELLFKDAKKYAAIKELTE